MTGTKIAVRGAILVTVIALVACGERSAPSEPSPAEVEADAEGVSGVEAPVDEDPAPASDGTPGFATPYPGAELQGPAVNSQNATDRGGMVTFTTPDHPEAVIAWYRERAEAAGLASAMTMTQGDTQVFGAQAEGVGANIQVVATPVDGETSVQVTWSSGE